MSAERSIAVEVGAALDVGVESTEFVLCVEDISASSSGTTEEVSASAPRQISYAKAPIGDVSFVAPIGTFRVGQEVHVSISWNATR